MSTLDGLIHFKFDPSHDAGLLFSPPRREEREYLGWNRALNRGQSLLNDAFESAIADVPTEARHVIPLSGGLDSRTVLAGVLDHVPPDRVTAVTVGVPGTWDFEFGRLVADAAGVDHEHVPITDIDWSVKALERTVRYESRVGGQALFGQAFAMTVFHQAIHDRFPDDIIQWKGFLGDVLAGNYTVIDHPISWEQACKTFCNSKCAVDPEFANPAAARPLLPDSPFVSADRLPFDEQLIIGVHQPCSTRPTAHPDVMYPFVNEELATFFLSLPDEWRRDRMWYKELVQQWKPTLFELPTTNTNGATLSDPWIVQRFHAAASWAVYDIKQALGREPVHPSNMYWNWDTAFRDPERLGPAADELLHSLATRELPIDIDPVSVFDRHQGGENFSDTIRSLGSFELFCRTIQQSGEAQSTVLGGVLQ